MENVVFFSFLWHVCLSFGLFDLVIFVVHLIFLFLSFRMIESTTHYWIFSISLSINFLISESIDDNDDLIAWQILTFCSSKKKTNHSSRYPYMIFLCVCFCKYWTNIFNNSKNHRAKKKKITGINNATDFFGWCYQSAFFFSGKFGFSFIQSKDKQKKKLIKITYTQTERDSLWLFFRLFKVLSI